MNDITAIGIDLGGTRVKGVIVDPEGVIFSQYYHSIEQDNWKQAVLDTVHVLKSKFPGDHLIGISAPGIPSEDNDRISYMPGRLQGLEGLVWSELLERPVHVVNDAVAALAAEAKFGTARDIRNAIMLTLGTGVGGAILIDGKIYNGAFQKAGHLGHITLNYSGKPDITGMPGSLEDAIGNCTISERSAGRYHYTHDLLEDVRKNDPSAKEIWMLSVQKLAVAIASFTNILSPQLVIIGGGIAEAGDLLFEPLEEYLSEYEWRAGGNKAQIVRACFGDMAGALGAAGFAMMKNETSS